MNKWLIVLLLSMMACGLDVKADAVEDKLNCLAAGGSPVETPKGGVGCLYRNPPPVSARVQRPVRPVYGTRLAGRKPTVYDRTQETWDQQAEDRRAYNDWKRRAAKDLSTNWGIDWRDAYSWDARRAARGKHR